MQTSSFPRALRRSADVPARPARRVLGLVAVLGSLLFVTAPARAQFTVTGSNSINYAGTETNHAGTSYIGTYGTGTATLAGGATRNIEGTFILGYGADDNGTMTITGANTVWTFAGTRKTAYIGYTGAGALNINDSGRMNFTGNLSMGTYAATATTPVSLTIASGGILATTASMTTSGITIGASGGTNSATISVDGIGSLLSVGGGIQFDANTSLTVTDGAQATFTKNITLRGSAATATTTFIRVAGAGSLVSTTAGLDAGLGSAGIGNLTVTDGGKLRVGGTFTLNRGTLKIGEGAAPGYLDTAGISVIQADNPTIEFNHTDDNYSFVNDAGNGIVLSSSLGVKVVAGTTVFTATSSYSGGTTITGGTLFINDVSPVGASGIGTGPITVGANGTLIFGTGGTSGTFYTSSAATITNNGRITFNRTGAVSLDGVISGNGSITKLGAGELSLNANNSAYTGTLTISGGLLTLYNVNALGASATTLAPGTTLKLATSGMFTGAVTLSGSGTDGTGALIAAAATPTLSGPVTLAGNTTVNVGWNANLTLTGALGESAAASGLTKLGLGTLTLANANTYTGETLISAGTVIAKHSGAFGAGAGGVTIAAGTALLLQGDATLAGRDLTLNGYGYAGNTGALRNVSGANTWGGKVTLGSDSYLDTAAGSVLTFNGGLHGGNLELTKNGAGTLVLGGAGTFTGTLTVNAGTLGLAHSSALQSATLNISNSTLSFGSLTAATLGGLTGASAISLTNDSGAGVTLTINSAVNSSYYSVLSGAGSLVKTGAGTFSLTGESTITGPTLVSAGTLNLGAPLALQYSPIEVASAGTLTFGGPDATIGGLNGTGKVSFGSSAIGLTVNTTSSSSFGGVISGYGSLTKAGTGTLTLSGTNTYTGATRINDGTFRVNGSLASSAVTVASGATLGGSGTIGGLATFASGAHLAPGTSPGTLSFTAGLTLNDGTILDLQLGTTSDKVIVSGGALSGPASGTITVNLSDSGGFTAGTYDFIDASGATLTGIDATSFELGTVIAGYDFTFTQSGNLFQLTAVSTAIPEPSTCAIIASFACLAVAVWRKRRS